MSRHGHYAATIINEGMGGRMKTKNGQLNTITKRLNPHQQAKRQEKIRARSTVAAQLTGQMNLLRMQMQQLVVMGPIARFKLRRQLRKTLATMGA